MAEKTLEESLNQMTYEIPEDIRSYFDEGEDSVLCSDKETAEAFFNSVREELNQKNRKDNGVK